MLTVRSVAVVGGGAWGTALANAAALAGRDVVQWFRDPAQAEAAERTRENARYLPGVALHERVRPTADPGPIDAADAVMLVVPAQAVRDTVTRLGPALPARAPLVICAKGIERTTGLFLSDVLREIRPDLAAAILSGPSFAADVARGLPTAVTLACPTDLVGAGLAAALSGAALRIYTTPDMRGVEIGGAAKNVLAIAAGIVEGRRLGESAKAALVARGFAELLRFALAEGGRPETLMGLSGLGDVVLSCASPQSRNFALGLALGRGEPTAAGQRKLAEGAFTADALVRRAAAVGVEMPVATAVAAVLADGLTVDDAIAALLARPLRAET